MNDANPDVASLPAKLQTFIERKRAEADNMASEAANMGMYDWEARRDLRAHVDSIRADIAELEAALAKPASGDGLPELVTFADASDAVRRAYRYGTTGDGFSGTLTWLHNRIRRLATPEQPGAKVRIPTETMEQEFASHYQRGYAAAKAEQPGSSVQGEAAEQDLRDFVEEIGTNGKPTGYFLFNAQPEVQGATYGIIDPDYARVFTIARCLAWAEGYALAMQGSFTRDLDLLAVPWTEAACEPEHLARRIEDAAGLRITAESRADEKPHGRIAWTLKFQTFGDPRFVDLSIMPRTTPPPAPAAEQGEAVELTKCCGREECGGECGNEWRGMEWVRKAQPEARGVEGMVLAFRRHYPEGGHSGWYDATMESDLLRALQGSGQSIEFAYSAAANPVRAEQPEGKGADRMAIRLLVAAGHVTEAKANEALCIAHGFQTGPLAAAPAAPGVRVDGVIADLGVLIDACDKLNSLSPTWPVSRDQFIKWRAALAPDGGEGE